MVKSGSFHSDEGSAQTKLSFAESPFSLLRIPRIHFMDARASFKKLWNYFLGIEAVRSVHNG
jgi:hypothetical protein